MTSSELRKKIRDRLEQVPDEQLPLVEEFLEFLAFRTTHSDTDPSISPGEAGISDPAPIQRGCTGKDLLQFVGTWQGDNLKDCLALVYATRSKAKFQYEFDPFEYL